MGMEPYIGASADTFKPLIDNIPNPIDNLRQAIAFKVGIAQKQAETQQAQAQAQELSTKLNRQQMFAGDLRSVQGNPSPQNVSALIMKYPEYAEQIKSGWNVKDTAQRDADLTGIGQVYAPAVSGDWKTAASAAHSRYDADKEAGQVTPDDDQFLKMVDAAAGGDAQAQKQVLTHLGLQAAAASGPEHFASVYGAFNKGDFTLDAGATRYDASGNPIVQSPFLKGADGTMYERDGANGTAPSTAAEPDTAPAGDGGFDSAVAFTLKHEGGYNPHDMNGAPVNFGINQGANPGVDVAKLTVDEAKGIYKQKYWDQSGAAKLPANMQTPYFDTYIINPKRAQQFLAKSGGDSNKFMQLREAWMGQVAAQHPQYAKAYATRNADLRLTMQGKGSTAAPAADDAPPGYHTLIPGKAKEAPTGFQWSADGKKLEAIPGGPADTTNDSLDPETVNFYAQQILAGTPMSQLSFGMGKAAAANRRQVMTQVAKIAGAEGLSGRDQAIQLAHYKAGVSNVTQLEKQLGTIQGNENTALANADQFLQRSQELPAQTGSRLLNTPIQTYLRQTNDPTVAAMDVAARTFATEYARVVAGTPSGGGTLSDSARNEFTDIVQGNFPLKQKLAAVNQMKIDMANRTAALKHNLQDAYTHLTDRAPELKGGGSAALPKGAKIVGTYHGHRVIQLPNGSRMVEQ